MKRIIVLVLSVFSFVFFMSVADPGCESQKQDSDQITQQKQEKVLKEGDVKVAEPQSSNKWDKYKRN